MGIDVAKRNPFDELLVSSPDTDVLLLLIYFYKDLCNQTRFLTGWEKNIREIDVGKAYEALGPKNAETILGFHTFSGCDQIERFNGKSKLSCWNTFIKADPVIIDAFIGLGTDQFLQNEGAINALEKYVIKLHIFFISNRVA